MCDPALRKQVLDGLESLMPDTQRAAVRSSLEHLLSNLRLYFFEGYALKEIAELTGRSLVNVRGYYYRGLEWMRKLVLPEKTRSK
jgi:DNA-directed RNA polymerase specialized sigma24 family protein